jgi:hypothetical protein
MRRMIFWKPVAIALLLLAQITVESAMLSAGPYQQSATGNHKGAEPDRLLSGSPFSLEQILKLLDLHPDRLSKAITNRGLTFEATPESLETLKKAGASDKLIELVRRRAPVKPVVAPPPPPPSGNVVAKCTPAECNISIDGKAKGLTTAGALRIEGMPIKEVVVDYEREGYIGQQKTIAILEGKDVLSEVALEPTESTKQRFGADLLSMTIQALGGDAGLKDMTSITATGAAVVWNSEGQRSDWTLNTLLKLPTMALFDLEGSSANFWLSLVGDKYKSGGDRKRLGSLLGASASDKSRSLAGGEFDSSLRIFRDFQVSALMDRMRNGGFRVSAPSGEADDKGEFHVRAAGNAEVYELTLSKEKYPARMMYKSDLGLGTGMELVYSNYKDAGKGKYPLMMMIKLPDAPHHGMEVHFETVTLSADLREKDFNGRFKPKK